MRKHRLSVPFASSAVAAGAVIGTAITAGQPAGATAITPGQKPASPEIGDLVLAAIPQLPSLTAVDQFPGRSMSLAAPWQVGDDVKTLQQQYAAHGYDLVVDGIFGPQTAGVTRQFQASKGLAVDGVAGPKTWAAAFDQPIPADPPPAPQITYSAPAQTPLKATASSSNSSVAGGVWAALRQCESGGNYSTSTGNGFGGAYQFSQSTWNSLGMSGSPATASPAQQDAAAQKLQAQSGWGPWPACSAKLGLR
jgi:peptidoglycan hydrolase-like protein with peptidoglycan-binding domain